MVSLGVRVDMWIGLQDYEMISHLLVQTVQEKFCSVVIMWNDQSPQGFLSSNRSRLYESKGGLGEWFSTFKSLVNMSLINMTYCFFCFKFKSLNLSEYGHSRMLSYRDASRRSWILKSSFKAFIVWIRTNTSRTFSDDFPYLLGKNRPNWLFTLSKLFMTFPLFLHVLTLIFLNIASLPSLPCSKNLGIYLPRYLCFVSPQDKY